MRIQYARTFSFFYVAVICTTTGGPNRYGLVYAVTINPAEQPINDQARNEAQVCRATVLAQTAKRETTDTS